MKTSYRLAVLAGLVVVWGAGAEIGPKVVPPSERNYSVEAIRESGERGGLLLHVGTGFTAADNRRMGEAMELWNAHRWAEARAAFNAIWTRHPESPWAAEAELHEACYLKYNARYDEAEERFLSVLSKHPAFAEMHSKVLHYLPHLYAQTGRYQTGLDLLVVMRALPLSWQEEQYLENYSRIFARALAKDNADRLCGTRALALALAAQNNKDESLRNVSLESVLKRHAWATERPVHAQGFSLQELAGFGNGQPVALDLETLRAVARPSHPVLVHLKSPAPAQCFGIFGKPQRQSDPPLSGHFVVVETIADSHADLLDPDAGRVRWPLAHFQYRWSGAALRLAGQDLPGKAVTSEQAQALRGGCCGSPPPDPDDECDEGSGSGGGGVGASGALVSPRTGLCGPTGCGGGSGGDCPCQKEEEGQENDPTDGSGNPPIINFLTGYGAPTYRFGLSSANLRLKDIPIWSTEAKGIKMNLQLIFNRVATQRMATNSGANYYAFGNKWHCNFFSHFTETPDGSGDIVLPGGRVQKFIKNPDGTYVASDVWNRNTLARTNNFFALTFKQSGNRWFFNTNTVLGQRLEKVEDPYGNAMTYYYQPVSGRLTDVTDAIGRSFRFYYDASGYVTNVSDLFGRSATFTYQSGDLVSLTDMGGLTTTIQYDTNHWPTNIIYPSGNAWKLHYTYGQDALYASYDEPFRVVVTDPLGQTSDYFYHSFDYMGPITLRDQMGNNWLYAAKTVGGSESGHGAQRIYYNGVNATVEPYVSTSDEWVHRTFDMDANPIEVATVNQNLPVYVGYNDNEGLRTVGALTTNLFDDRHNLISSTLLTNVGDPYYPDLQLVGTWTNWYDGRDNLLGTRNPLNQSTRYAYSAKDELVTITNALNQVTRMIYDHNGNLTNVVDALLRTNRWTYDLNGRKFETIYADNLRLSRGYDAMGRVNAFTNHGSGFYLSYFYDNLNRLRDVNFPDGTSNHFEYSCCGLDWTRDRLNRMTIYGRDTLGRTTSLTNAENCLVEFRYNGANQITNLITHVSGQTREKKFDYTSTNGFSRLTQVTTPMGKLIRYDYTFRGGLAWRQDGNGNLTKYQYDLQDRLACVTDNNDVPLVSMSYDVLGNVTHVAATNSVFDYSYDGLNRVTNTVCLLTNIPGFATVKYKVAYAFDPVGNVTNRVITGLQGMSGTITTRYQFDIMNRLTNVVQLTNDVTSAAAYYSYDDSGRLWRKGYGNGDVVTHGYDSESRLVSMGITNNTTSVLWYGFGWDAGGNILAITNNGTNISLYGYDRVGQLTNEVLFTNGLAGFTTNAWQYDEAGNWLNALGESQWLYNSDNEMVARGPSGTPAIPPPTTLTLTGEVEPGPNSNKWFNTWAECKGVRRQVSTSNGMFSLPGITINQWGENVLDVTVRDVSGNAAQQQRRVVKGVPGALETFRYDGNGNLTNWSNGSTNWVYEWDWESRLSRAKSNGVVVIENWYDGYSRRIAKIEQVEGQAKFALYVWDLGQTAALINQDANVLETFTRGVGLVADIGTLVAATYHPGSTCKGTVYVHNNHRGDVIATRSAMATAGTFDYDPFGDLKRSVGSDASRFKFSSKERDISTHFYYYGNRFYAPKWQRWANRDPIEESGGANLYGFVFNNPISNVDTYGEGSADTKDKPKQPPPKKPPTKKPPTDPWRAGANCQQWCKDKSEDMCAACCEEQFTLDEALNPRRGLQHVARRNTCLSSCALTDGARGPR